MSLLTSIIGKVDKIMNKVTPMDRTAYTRIITKTGDTLIGRTSAPVYTDTLLAPQPVYTRLGRDRIPGGHARAETVIDASGKAVIADDYEVLISPTAITQATLQNKNFVLVLKSSDGTEEMLRLLDVETPSITGGDALFICFMRSVRRP